MPLLAVKILVGLVVGVLNSLAVEQECCDRFPRIDFARNL